VKTVIPAGTTNAPAIKVIPTFKHDGDMKLENELSALRAVAQESGQRTILLLGPRAFRAQCSLSKKISKPRYYFQRRSTLLKAWKRITTSCCKHLKGQIGFPSEIVDDPLLTMVSPKPSHSNMQKSGVLKRNKMTRARKLLTIMGSAAKPSVFVEELLEDAEYGLLPQHRVGEVQTCGECQASPANPEA
jgi:DNA helicase-4